MLIAFNKPFGILSQFTVESAGQRTLAEFGFPKEVYPVGRLDADSEGLLLLTDEKGLNERLLHPRHGHRRRYWAQVERIPTARDLERLSHGVHIRGVQTRPCRAWVIEPQPAPSERTPPIRFRKNVPTCWIALELVEGMNRQVRRMTAAIGFPTLRLIRVMIGTYPLEGLQMGEWRLLTLEERRCVFAH
jgi:23S rRNA pseudouridine2457 synthase